MGCLDRLADQFQTPYRCCGSQGLAESSRDDCRPTAREPFTWDGASCTAAGPPEVTSGVHPSQELSVTFRRFAATLAVVGIAGTFALACHSSTAPTQTP